MDKEDLLYIEDTKKRKLFYRFTPAAFISNFVPLIVVLHGEEESDALHFEYKMWNVLTPIDDFGYENRWLGEKGDFFVRDLLQALIHKIAEEYECEEHIYLYGRAIGGYGAILHGILCKANAVYAQTPLIRLLETDGAMTSSYPSAVTEADTNENDLSSFLNLTDDFPIFYLCDNAGSVQSSDNNPLEDEVDYFADACRRYAIKVDREHCSKSADEEQRLKEVLDMFERVTP